MTLTGKLSLDGLGQKSQLWVHVALSDGTVRDMTPDCLWDSPGPRVATVSKTGLLTAVEYGTGKVRVMYGDLETVGSVTVRVTDVPRYLPLAASQLVGPWRNVGETDGVTRIDMRLEDDRVWMHTWGACFPTECDHGEESTPVDDGDDGVLSLTRRTNYGVEYIQVRLLTDDRLELWRLVHFTPGSGHKDYNTVDYFRRTSS